MQESGMGFIRTFVSICSGTDVFLSLLKVSVFKCLWHLFLLIFLCSLLLVTVKYSDIESTFGQSLKALDDRFGKVVVTEQGLLPELNPSESSTLRLTESIRLDYFPSADCDFKTLGEYGAFIGVIWTPNLVFLWLKASNGDFIPNPETFAVSLKRGDRLPTSRHSMDKDELLAFVKANSSTDGELLLWYGFLKEKLRGFPYTFGSFKEPMIGVYTAGVFIFHAIQMLITAFVFASMLCLIYMFMGNDVLSKLRFGRLFVIAIYAGFPAMLIASLFKAFELPLLDYQWVYTIGFLFYLFPVFNRIQRYLISRKSETRGSGTF